MCVTVNSINNKQEDNQCRSGGGGGGMGSSMIDIRYFHMRKTVVIVSVYIYRVSPKSGMLDFCYFDI